MKKRSSRNSNKKGSNKKKRSRSIKRCSSRKSRNMRGGGGWKEIEDLVNALIENEKLLTTSSIDLNKGIKMLNEKNII